MTCNRTDNHTFACVMARYFYVASLRDVAEGGILICKIFDVCFLTFLGFISSDDKENNAVYQYGTSSCLRYFLESKECQSELLRTLPVILPQS